MIKRTLITILFIISFTVQAQDYYSYADVIQGDKPDSKWMLGGYGSLGFTSGFLFLELAPEAAYKVTEGFHAGGGLSYIFLGREVTYQGQQLRNTSTAWGGRAFLRGRIYKRWHIRVEYEQMNTEYLEPVPNAEFERIWQGGLNTGLEILTEQLLGDYTFLGFYYNLLYVEDKSPHVSPFTARFGVYL